MRFLDVVLFTLGAGMLTSAFPEIAWLPAGSELHLTAGVEIEDLDTGAVVCEDGDELHLDPPAPDLVHAIAVDCEGRTTAHAEILLGGADGALLAEGAVATHAPGLWRGNADLEIRLSEPFRALSDGHVSFGFALHADGTQGDSEIRLRLRRGDDDLDAYDRVTVGAEIVNETPVLEADLVAGETYLVVVDLVMNAWDWNSNTLRLEGIECSADVLDAPSLDPSGFPGTVRVVPNPFRSTTDVVLGMLHRDVVTLEIVDVAGRVVRTLFTDVPIGPGERSVSWHGRTDDGHVLASGVYVVRLRGHGPDGIPVEEHDRMLVLR